MIPVCVTGFPACPRVPTSRRCCARLRCVSPVRGWPCWPPCTGTRTPTDAGLLRRFQPEGTVARYEARVGDNHHHLVCRSCGAIVDVDCAVGEASCLTASDHAGYTIDEAEVIYWGRCPSCSRRPTVP